MANEVYTTGVQYVQSGDRIFFNPGAGREMTLHNISASQPCTLEVYDANQDEYVQADVISEAGSWMGVFLHCTEGCHYAVWNSSANGMTITANGRYSK